MEVEEYVATVFTNAWNFLTINAVKARSVDCFKNRLDEHWTDHDLIYSTIIMDL